MHAYRSYPAKTMFVIFAVFALTSTTIACSADYLIWMIRDKSADPLYRFVRGEKVGYINRMGKVVIPPSFDVSGNYGDEFHDGLLTFIGLEENEFIDKKGRSLRMTNVYSAGEFSEGLAIASAENGGKLGYIDTTGKFVIPPKFETYPNGTVWPFSNGYAVAEIKERVGYINKVGDFAIPPKFIRGSSFNEERAWVVVDGPCHYVKAGPCVDIVVVPFSARKREDTPACKYALIDKTGGFVSRDTFDGVQDFSEGFAAVRINDSWGYLDKSGTIKIAPQFAIAHEFNNGLALVGFRSNRKDRASFEWGYINRSGVVVIPAKFARAESFSEGLAVVADSLDGPYYYIGATGKRAISQNFIVASPFFGGLAHVKPVLRNGSAASLYDTNGEYAYIDQTGRAVFKYNR